MAKNFIKPVFPQCSEFVEGPVCYNCKMVLCKKFKCKRRAKCPKGDIREHIPPECFFRQHKKIGKITENPLRAEITVPSCLQCNHQASESDDCFVRYIVIASKEFSPFAQAVFEKRRRSWLENKKIGKELARAEHGYIDIQTPAGIIVDRRHAVVMPPSHTKHFFNCLDKIVRALYYKHVGRVPSFPFVLCWNSVFLKDNNGRGQYDTLPEETAQVIRTIFASSDVQREENGIKVTVRCRSLQNNVFSYALMDVQMAEWEFPLLFLNFYGVSQFIYIKKPEENIDKNMIL